MRRIRTIFCGVVCVGIVIILILFAMLIRSRGYYFHHTQMKSTSKRVFETIKRNGTNQGVTDIKKLCEVPRGLTKALENLKQKNITELGVNTSSFNETDEENQISEFSIHKKLDSYPINGTGSSVDNFNDNFDPAVFNAFCETSANLTATVPVYSTADRFGSRQLLRNSLGRLATSLNCKMFFITGVSTDADVNELLQEEYVVERDILVIDKVDTYRDLNNKAYAMLHWINKFCKHVPYAVHLIDDTYVNLRLMLQRLHGFKDKNYIYARKADTHTVRTTELKSFVTVDEYIYDRFPPYAYGMVYAFPTVVAERVLRFAHNATYCWIEDVWIGGHVRIAADVKLKEFGKNDWCNGNQGRLLKQKSPPSCFGMHPVEVDVLCRWYNHNLGTKK